MSVHHQVLKLVADAVTRSPARDRLTRWAITRSDAPGAGRAATVAAVHLRLAMTRRGGLVERRLPTGSVITLDLADWIHQRIYLDGVWEPGTTALFRRLVEPGWTVADVGANAGYYSLMAADLGGPGSVIHAFEPNPVLAGMLESSLERSGHRTVSVFRTACGAETEHRALYLSPDGVNTGSSTLVPESASSAATLDVSVVRLDDHCSGHSLLPDLVKIDVEGFEGEVLKGMERLLEQGWPRYIVCEIHHEGAASSHLTERLEAHGFRPHLILDDGTLRPLAKEEAGNVCFVASAAEHIAQ